MTDSTQNINSNPNTDTNTNTNEISPVVMTANAPAPEQAFDLIITCADGLEKPLQAELTSFAIDSTLVSTGRISAKLTLIQMYHVCLWSRVASRVLLPLKKRNINTEYDIAEQIYDLSKSVDWTEQFDVEQTFAIRASVDKRVAVNQQFTMLRIKDGIVDVFTNKLEQRPNVDSKNPDINIFATISGKKDRKIATAELFIDLSGSSLHRRGYRTAMTDAPIKENLAAALLYTVGWHEQSSHDTNTALKFDALIDPMCGSGTFLIEALLMYIDYPVGIAKAARDFGFYSWKHHDDDLWEEIVSDAHDGYQHRLAQISAGEIVLPKIIGCDSNIQAIKATRKNIQAAGLGEIMDMLILNHSELSNLAPTLSEILTDMSVDAKNTDANSPQQTLSTIKRPLIISNPPYGERIGDVEGVDTIKPLYQGFGLQLQTIFDKHNMQGTLGLLAMEVEQADVLPIIEPQTLRCHNGAITVYFRYGALLPTTNNSLISNFERKDIELDEAQDFVNRLQKNLVHLKKIANRTDVTNLRVYNADLPNFKVAVDIYGDNIHVQEYAPPKNIPVETARKRFNLALQGVRDVLGVNREQVFIKTRAKQSGNDQYGKQSTTKSKPVAKTAHYNKNFTSTKKPVSKPVVKQGKKHVVRENNALFYVNFTDYLDTGLFIDHRNMRKLVKKASRGKRVLNLFAYTCTASVHAALAGAEHVTSVDLSANYLDWGKQNFALNGLDVSDEKYSFVAEDIFTWIKNNSEQYDTIFIDPPTFSNSKKFSGTFDIQRDHSAIINRAMNRLASGGVLYFSNNFTKFVMDEQLYSRYDIQEITKHTIGFDFSIKKPIHRSFEIRNK